MSQEPNGNVPSIPCNKWQGMALSCRNKRHLIATPTTFSSQHLDNPHRLIPNELQGLQKMELKALSPSWFFSLTIHLIHMDVNSYVSSRSPCVQRSYSPDAGTELWPSQDQSSQDGLWSTKSERTSPALSCCFLDRITKCKSRTNIINIYLRSRGLALSSFLLLMQPCQYTLHPVVVRVVIEASSREHLFPYLGMHCRGVSIGKLER